MNAETRARLNRGIDAGVVPSVHCHLCKERIDPPAEWTVVGLLADRARTHRDGKGRGLAVLSAFAEWQEGYAVDPLINALLDALGVE